MEAHPSLVPAGLGALLTGVAELNGAYLVGGCVRDWLLEMPVKDYDIEVFGVSYEQLSRALAKHGRVDLVGRSFGVIKFTTKAGETFDFSIPRRDSKVAAGHKGFTVEFDAAITPLEAATRRDYTINALMFDPRRREILDHCGGQDDLRQRILRHTSNAFSEDPLRVLRGMQFVARFDLTIAPETLALCQQLQDGFAELAAERVREEWFKWSEKSAVPSRGLSFLADTGWIKHFPEIDALRVTPQDPEWHPEGNVFVHTCHCLDALVHLDGWRAADLETRIVLSLAVLAHDFAKPQTTQKTLKDGRWRITSAGHEAAGGPVTESFLGRMRVPMSIQDRIIPLVTNHLAHLQPSSERSVRRLARRLQPATIQELLTVITADHFGRPPKAKVMPEGALQLQSMAASLALEQSGPKPILLGRHLIEMGQLPSPAFGEILEKAFEAQLDGQFADLSGARDWLRQYLAQIPGQSNSHGSSEADQ